MVILEDNFPEYLTKLRYLPTIEKTSNSCTMWLKKIVELPISVGWFTFLAQIAFLQDRIELLLSYDTRIMKMIELRSDSLQ